MQSRHCQFTPWEHRQTGRMSCSHISTSVEIGKVYKKTTTCRFFFSETTVLTMKDEDMDEQFIQHYKLNILNPPSCAHFNITSTFSLTHPFLKNRLSHIMQAAEIVHKYHTAATLLMWCQGPWITTVL